MLMRAQNIDFFNPQVLFITHNFIGKDDLPKIQYHCHSFVEFTIVTSGTINYNIDGNKYSLKENDVLIANPGVYHQGLVDRHTVCSELFIGIANLNIDSVSANYVRALDGAPILSITKYKKEFAQCLKAIIKEQRLRQLGHSFILKSLVMQLIIILYREMEHCSSSDCCPTNQLIIEDTKSIVQNLIDYMSDYYMTDITLDYLSEIMHISPAYISKIFKEETGSSPIQYLIQIRMDMAKSFLASPEVSIKEVSNKVGYQDAYYFSRLFKKHYGVSPSAYRDGF